MTSSALLCLVVVFLQLLNVFVPELCGQLVMCLHIA